MKKYVVVVLILVFMFVGSMTFKYVKLEKNKSNFKDEEEIVPIKSENIDKSNKEIKTEKYPGINKLMIVAHPDDESYWGGAHLIEDDYLVVCITCGTVKKRVTEFKTAMDLTNDEYIMLNYPDRNKMGKKDDWSSVYKNIKVDLEKIINSKHWEMIVTHNPDGEYGHIHHIKTNRMVTELADKDVLYYFGKYFSKKNLEKISGMKTISDKSLKRKEKDLIPIYKSQKNAENAFKHMFKYENFVFNKNWKVKL